MENYGFRFEHVELAVHLRHLSEGCQVGSWLLKGEKEV